MTLKVKYMLLCWPKFKKTKSLMFLLTQSLLKNIMNNVVAAEDDYV